MKNTFPTLEQIQELLLANNKILIAAFDKDYKHLEGLIYSLDNKVEDFRTEVYKRFEAVDKRFDKVEDQIKSLDERLIVQSERLKKVEPTRFVAP